LATMLFPSIRTRFAIALLLTFFPFAFLYPLLYPSGQILTLCCWVWVFPSPLGWLSLGLVPLIPSQAYGYYAFNLFCLIVNLAIARSALRCTEFSASDLDALYRLARFSMAVTIVIASIQAVTDPYFWTAIFPYMRLVAGRGAGLRLEPSQLSCLLALYLALLAVQTGRGGAYCNSIASRRHRLWEGITMILLTVAVSGSISVLIIALCFAPALYIRRRHIVLLLASSFFGVIAAFLILGNRINDAIKISSGSIAELLTTSVDSWRNIPDFLILSNYSDFLYPGNPSEVRLKIRTFAVLLNPGLAWVQNTFSEFSVAGVTAGLVGTFVLLATGLVIGMKSLPASAPARLTWFMVYLAAWFIMAKWDPSAWVVLGLLPLMRNLNKPTIKQCAQG